MLPNQKGFTLLEILLVVAAIAILAGIVIVAINPGKQLADTRNATRQTDVKTISDAVYQYSFDHGGVFPSGIDTNLRMLGTGGSGCGVSCGSTSTSSLVTSPQTITDNSASTFNSGSYSGTVFDATNNWVQLTSGGSAGTYTSAVKDGGSDSATWSSLAWVPQFPSHKELPNNGGSETGYPSGNVDMTGNMGLWHLNESDGSSFSDTSGNNLTGTCFTGRCPTLGTSGKFGTAPRFNSVNKEYISLGNIFNDTALKYTMTAEGWFLVSSPPSGIRAIITKAQFSADNSMFALAIWSNGLLDFLVHDDANTGYHLRKSEAITVDNQWHHVAGTWNNGVQTLYYDGIPVASFTRTFTKLNDSYGHVFIGAADSGVNWHWDGALDEVAVYNRSLSAAEIKDIYSRGATRLKLQARSCNESSCATANFAGPDGTANTFYTELSNTTLSPPSFSLSNIAANKYFQYKATLETDNTGYSPEIKSVSVSGTATSQPTDYGISGPTPDQCLDLSPSLISDYITAIPLDPKIGSVNNTYYAIKKTANGRIVVMACSAENGKSINAKR